jgi:hypothetical protein
MGKACQLCPGISDINLFGYGQGVIHFDAQISDRAFDLGMPEQKLDGPEIAGPPVDKGSFRASQGVRPEQSWVQSNAADPLRNEARILARCNASFGTTTTVNKNSPGLLLAAFR